MSGLSVSGPAPMQLKHVRWQVALPKTTTKVGLGS